MISTIMPALDPAGEFLRVAEHYRRMSDEELLVLARQKSDLTDLAQQALESEMSHRRLEAPVEEPPAPPKPPPPDSEPGDPYAEQRRLVEVCKVWSLSDALQVQRLLDRVSIPFFMGPENAPGVEPGSSNFANGVSVKVMNIGVPWATQALKEYAPENEPAQKPKPEPQELPVRCPKCDSPDVIFDSLITRPADEDEGPAQIYKWICDSCGHEWEDDGAAGEGAPEDEQ